jgi:FixJ family two-component response regulator
MAGRFTIFFIDDDASVRRALQRVMTSAELDSVGYASVEDFFAMASLHSEGCIVADMDMPGLSGLDLKHLLNAALCTLPLIFLTAKDTEETRAAAREAGAVGCYRKPVDTQALLDAVRWAMKQSPPVLPA